MKVKLFLKFFLAYDRSTGMYKYVEGESLRQNTNKIIESRGYRHFLQTEIQNQKKEKMRRAFEIRKKRLFMENQLKKKKQHVQEMVDITGINVKFIPKVNCIRIEFLGLNDLDKDFVCYCDFDIQDQQFICLNIFPEFEDYYVWTSHLMRNGNLKEFVWGLRPKFLEYFEKLAKA